MIFLTGATGFIGRALLKELIRRGCGVSVASRRKISDLPGEVIQFQVQDLSTETNWTQLLDGIDVVIHAAARAHVMNDSTKDPITEYRKVNVEGTLNLARQAAVGKIKRFIFISSIKVNGESTLAGRAFTVDEAPSPVDPYGISKWETEVGLHRLSKETGMEVVIIRAPLVYGSGVKGNLQSMMRWINRGVPLPLGAIHNKRSLVSLDNLVDLIITCIEHPAAANQTFLAGDGEDLSTTELLQRMGKALGKPVRLVPLPAGFLTLIASLLGKKDVSQRLFGSLQVDISKARELLGWEPHVSVEEGFRKTAEDFKNG